MIEYQTVNSTNIASVGYDHDTREMTITFKRGGTYTYSSVDESTYQELVAASSPGQYFARQIEGQYNFRRGQ